MISQIAVKGDEEERGLSKYKSWIENLSGKIVSFPNKTCMVHCANIFVERFTYSVLSESEENTNSNVKNNISNAFEHNTLLMIVL